MSNYQDYLYVGDATIEYEDVYGPFVEYEVTLGDELRQIAIEQLAGDYIASDDSYIDAYLRRYSDGLTRIWLGVHEDFTPNGEFLERELDLDESYYEVLDAIEV